MELWYYQTIKLYKTAEKKNNKEYQKGFIHLGKLHRIHKPGESGSTSEHLPSREMEK